MILAIKNPITDDTAERPPDAAGTGPGVADRIVRRSLAKREGEYAGEVRRLLDAALEVMQQCGAAHHSYVRGVPARCRRRGGGQRSNAATVSGEQR